MAFIYGLYFFQETTGWEPSDRGVSYRFGSDVVDAFLAKNNLSLIVRAHQVVEDGYEFFHERALVTLFSAPNYCGQFDNAGAMMTVKEDLTCSFSILPVSFFLYPFFFLPLYVRFFFLLRVTFFFYMLSFIETPFLMHVTYLYFFSHFSFLFMF